jgi:heterogeneous nuclear rnp K-like protein 2
MGSVIGKGGSKIKEIQEASGARLQASEAMLPGSSEVGALASLHSILMEPLLPQRILTVSGVADAIHIAVYYVGTILQENGEKQYENRPYRPGYRDAYSSRDTYERDGRDAGSYRPGGSSRGDDDRRGAGDRSATADRPRGPGSYQSTADQPGSQTQQMFIPDDLVAAIIGKGGNKINEVRQKSATNIKIMEPNEEPQKNAAEGDRVRWWLDEGSN